MSQPSEPADPDVTLSPGPHPTSERRQVTVACCELVGREGPSGPPQALDPEALYEPMLRLRDLAGEVARRYDGQLRGLPGGHRVLLCFGYPHPHEDNARRAVLAALDLADQTTSLNAKADRVFLSLRVGVHTGMAVVTVPPQPREPMTLGSTFDLALQLQSLAAPGHVVVSPDTCCLIERSFALEALPSVQLPGTAVPLTPCRALEPLEASEDVLADLPPMVGREREMDQLLSRWDLVREGNGQVVVISGEAGIGKSRLVHAFRERLGKDEVTWWTCSASPYSQSSPLHPVSGLMRQILLRGDGTSPLDRLESSLRDLSLADAAPLLAPLLDIPSDERLPALNLSPERQREKTLEALADWVVETAERQPLVLIVEDLHWLDPTTRAWLDLLIDQAAGAPLLLLLTVRLHTMEALWGPRAHLAQLTLNPLSDSEAERLIGRVAGERPLPAEVRRRIVARTDGVPLFLEELTKDVLESHGSSEREELPATLRDSLAERLDRLGSAKEIAQIAAVIGRVFTFELLAAVCASVEAVLLRELRRLVQAELVYRQGFGGKAKYLFKHALIQDAAYESLLKRERRQIHRRIAETMAARFPETLETTPEILAHHYTEAGLTGPAIDGWMRAAKLASRRSADLEVLDHLDRALRLLQDLPEGSGRDRGELRIQNARAAAMITSKGYTGPEVERTCARAEVLAERLGEAEERFWAVLGLNSYNLAFGNLPQARHHAERLLRIAESERRPDFLSIAWLCLGVYYSWNGDFDQALSAMERACELAPPDDHSHRIHNGTDLRVVAHSLSALVLWNTGRPDLAWQRGEQAVARARQLGFPFTFAFAAIHVASLAQHLHDAETTQSLSREVHDLSTELGFPQFTWLSPFLLSWSALYTSPSGHPEAELGDLASSKPVLAKPAGCAMAYYFCLHAEVLTARGCHWEAWRTLDEGLRLSLERGVSIWVEEIYRLQGELLLKIKSGEPALLDREAEAERLFQASLDFARCKKSKTLGLRTALSLAKLWQRQGRTREARDLVAEASQGFTGTCRELAEAREFLNS